MQNNAEKLTKICEILNLEHPNPETELNYVNNFTLLVAIILSAQATDKMVNIVTENLFKIADSPEKILSLGLENLKQYINKLNYYNTKAKNICKMCEILIHIHNSAVPASFEELIALPGVGRKTANVFLNIAHNLPTIAVDTHVFRVTNRVFGTDFTSPEAVEDFLMAINPKEFAIKTHHLLILHGRYTCKARAPACEGCKLKELCKKFV